MKTDSGTQYRSGIYTFTDLQQKVTKFAKRIYDKQLSDAGLPNTTTEILPATEFYCAEDYHQQYFAKNPDGYCGLGGLGVKYHNDK